MAKLVHWLCSDNKTMCGREKGKMKATRKLVEEVTCSKCKIGIKFGWRDGGPGREEGGPNG
jgi:hypothetical protein